MRHECSYWCLGLRIIEENNEFQVVRQILQVCFFQPLMILEATILDDPSVVQIGQILSGYDPLERPASVSTVQAVVDGPIDVQVFNPAWRHSFWCHFSSPASQYSKHEHTEAIERMQYMSMVFCQRGWGISIRNHDTRGPH